MSRRAESVVLVAKRVEEFDSPKDERRTTEVSDDVRSKNSSISCSA